MAAHKIAEVLETLTPDQQQSVFQFIEFLKRKDAPISFRAAAAEFIEEHPELFRRLAQ